MAVDHLQAGLPQGDGTCAPFLPDDWPAIGRPITPVTDDPPRASPGLEWWYVNCHLTTRDGREFSAFAAFFRHQFTGAGPTHSHALNWGIFDAGTGGHWSAARVDAAGVSVAARMLAADQVLDPAVRAALLEQFSTGVPPLPDRLIDGPVEVGEGTLDLRYGRDGRLTGEPDGSYRLAASSPGDGTGLSLTVRPRKPPVLCGEDGVVRGEGPDDAMFYYSVTRCDAAGWIEVDGVRHEVTGTAWFDHEFGARVRAADEGLSGSDSGWHWFGLQLDDGSELTVYDLYEVAGPAGDRVTRQLSPLYVPADGAAAPARGVRLTAEDGWTSLATFNRYPVRWRLAAAEPRMDLTIRACADRQEVRTLATGFARGFWEGRVTVSGTVDGRPVSGLGFAEMVLPPAVRDIEQFLGKVAGEVRAEIGKLYPPRPPGTAAVLLGAADGPLRAGVRDQQLHDALVAPVRHLIDQGGKAWRPYLMLMAVQACGGSGEEYRPLFAAAELLHDGSLIIDDVEDEAAVRRGAPSSHVRFGTARAVNAGTAAYFAFDHAVRTTLPDDPALRQDVYELYLGALRAGHAGQGLDILGQHEAAARAVRTGDFGDLEQRVLATHWLKSGVPAGSFARLAARLAGAGPAVLAAFGAFGESLGVAYQVADDVLDLTGHSWRPGAAGGVKPLRPPGEDIRNGKVTLPLARALAAAGGAGAGKLYDAVAACPGDPAAVADCIAAVLGSGAAQSCLDYADQLVEQAWAPLTALLPDTDLKVMLRAFSWYAVDRARPAGQRRGAAGTGHPEPALG